MTTFNVQLFKGNNWVADRVIEAQDERQAARKAKRQFPGTRAFVNGSTKPL